MKRTSSLMLVGLIALSILSGCTSQETVQSNTDNKADVIEKVIPDKPKEVIVNEINQLLKGKDETIARYFGESDIYTSDAVKDRISVAKVTFIDIKVENKEKAISKEATVEPEKSTSKEATQGEEETVEPEKATTDEETSKEATVSDGAIKSDSKETEKKQDSSEAKTLEDIDGIDNGKIEVTLHICTMDYNKTKKAVDSLTERMKIENPTMTQEEMNDKVTKEIASRAQNGEFEVHITMPVTISYRNGESKLELTEAFKAAITGGWYNPTGATLVSGDCPLREAAQAEADKIDKTKSPAIDKDVEKQ